MTARIYTLTSACGNYTATSTIAASAEQARAQHEIRCTDCRRINVGATR